MSYAVYLRKSRADKDAELKGEGETLARHEKILLELAAHRKLSVTNVYREIVSGETIASRPAMRRLLADVEEKVYEGVLVIEIERLARGDTIDQGIVFQAFKLSETKIITPLKTYDPNDEYDEEYFEFGLFMSRREYKTINRRLQSGRLASVKEGKYVGNKPPYGYNRVKTETGKGYTLEPNPEEAQVVKMIYDFYTCDDRIGMSLITRKLNDMQIKPRHSDVWALATVKEILTNPVYIGLVHWNARKTIKRMVGGEVLKSRPRAADKDITIAKGLHEPLIDKGTWEKAQLYRSKNRRPSVSARLTNPLAGLLICGKCGRRMSRRFFKRSGKQYLLCPVTSCGNVSVQFEFAEEAVITGLEEIMNNCTIKVEERKSDGKNDVSENIAVRLKKEIEKLEGQLGRLHDFLEQGIYTTDVFFKRSEILEEKIGMAKNELDKLGKKNKRSNIETEDFIPKIKNVVDAYRTLNSAEAKNRLLKTIVNKIVYTKDKGGRWHNDPKDFKIEIVTVI